MVSKSSSDAFYQLPPLGNNPSSQGEGTTPGSFARKPDVGGPRAFSSPDAPGMPEPSTVQAPALTFDPLSLGSLICILERSFSQRPFPRDIISS